MKRYPEYKNNQLGWVGEIPKHWEVIKFHYLSQESRRKNDDDVDREMLSLSSYTGIQVKQYEYENTKRSKEESLTYFVVEPNQLVVNPMWQIQRGIGVSYLHGIVSPGYRVYYIDLERLIPQYLHYLMRSDGYVDEYNKHIRGLTTYDRSVRKEDFEEIGVLLPPKQEQTQIADFLDRKTGQIDELIRIKERRIELLQEQRTALINQAVTKGLDPNVEMKPSGVEWIGEMPEHWETKAVWMMFRLGRGRVISNEEMGDHPGQYPVYSSQTENEGIMGYIDTYDFDGDYITWTTDGAKAGTVFYRTGQFSCTNVCGTLLPTNQNLDLRFFHHALNIVTPRFVRYDINPKLMNNVMATIRVQVPPAAEQYQIANFLDCKTQQIDELLSAEQRKIELLKEYRQSLISEAVTGKIDVRNGG